MQSEAFLVEIEWVYRFRSQQHTAAGRRRKHHFKLAATLKEDGFTNLKIKNLNILKLKKKKNRVDIPLLMEVATNNRPIEQSKKK